MGERLIIACREKIMARILRSFLLASFLAAPSAPCQQISSISYVATFNNIGIEVTFTGAAPAGGSIGVAVKNGQASQAWRDSHPLSRIANDHFAGSVFGLTAGTLYSIRLRSSIIGADRIDTVSTRTDSVVRPGGIVYHVAKGGSDANNGTSPAAAFATLGHALAIAQPGATILLHAGRFCESVDVPRSGTETAPILIRNAPGEAAILDGCDTAFAPAWSVYNATANIYRTACKPQPYLAFYNGGHLFASPTLADLVSNTWSMASGFFADGAWLYVRLPHAGAPTAADTVRIPALTTAITCTGRQFIQIKGLEICHYGLGEYSRGIYFDGASFNLVDSCFLHHSGVGVAFKRACTFNTVQHCSFTESPIDTWNWSAVKEGTGYYEAGGVVVYGSSGANTGNVIRNNRFFHMFDGSHLYSDDGAGPTTDMDFHDNIIESVNDDCIETDGAGSNCRIYNNTFRTFLTGVSVAPAAGGPTYIFRNLFSGWETHSGYVGYPVKFNVSSSLSIDWIYLYHNTCFTSAAGQPGFLFKQYSNWNNVISRNNIYAGTGNALESWPSANPVDFDYDALFTTATSRLVSWVNVNYTTAAAFFAACGQEQHGIAGDPQFVNAAGGDFHLSAQSPLKDRGVVIPGINDGYRDSGPDIGCFERGADGVIAAPARSGQKGILLTSYSDKATGRVTIRFSPGNAAISIYSLAGELVFRKKSEGRAIVVGRDGRMFGPGVYIVQATAGAVVFRSEFVVMR
jgi:hypothetical protein